MSKLPEHTVSSGNVFADLGLPNADELLAKSNLVIQITRLIEERGLTQAEAAEVLGVDQPKVSALVRGRLAGFSMERLYRFLNALGSDVDIVVRPKARNRSEGVVRVITQTRLVTSAAKSSHPKRKPKPATKQRAAKRPGRKKTVT
jgi:predicted XRE-type DNA-binding protein